MKKPFLLIVFFLLAGFTASAQSTDVQDEITEQRVEYLISTLSSDKMMGRKAFTPYIRKAGHFISDQFDKTGLEPLNNGQDYSQCFDVHTLHPGKQSLEFNGNEIPTSSFFASVNHSELNWRNLDKIKTLRIRKDDDFQSSFARISDAVKEPAVILVHKAHQAFFERYANYFSGSTSTMRLNEAPGILFILTDEDTIANGSFYFSQAIENQEACNIAGKITGTSKKDEYVIFSAHYDHIGTLEPVEGDSIANGADDNASGTTAVISLAEYYKKLGPQERTLIFVAFTAEEVGGYGSGYFSRQLNPDHVAAMFNIEMIGKPSRFGPNTAFLTGFEKSSMGEILQADLEGSPYQIYPDPYPEQNLFYRSDNATLARLGVPAHTVSSVQIDRDPHYHTVSDELESLDIEHLTNMIRAIVLSSKSIVSGSVTPTRVDPASLN